MDMQQGLRKRLIDDTALAAEVGTRVDWGKRPQGSSLPAVTLVVINDGRPVHLKGQMSTRSTNVQVDVYAETYQKALSIARMVIDALRIPMTVSGKTFGAIFVDSQRETTEALGTMQVHRQSIDFTVWHKGD